MILLHNTLTGLKEEFKPQDDSRVSLYTCGPTVYNEPHIGNWVAYVRWDMLVRTIKANDFNVERVMNITDVGHLTSDADSGEDKMQKGARREGVTEWEIAQKYIESFLSGMSELNLLPPEYLVRATDHIDIQIDLAKKLEEKGYTYLIDDGLYFDTSKFEHYANFAHLDLEAQRAGARVDYNTNKKNSSDFVVWRLTPMGESRNMEWDSPWGKGIPGWHLECSAMAMKYLGDTIDIHTGGIDHIPVHHTNEIAQSEAASDKKFANYWLHNAHLLSDGTKLSKSLNNSYTLEDIKNKGFTSMAVRMFLLQSHYRTETNFTWQNLEAAQNRLNRWLDIACLRWQTHDTLQDDDVKDQEHDVNGMLLSSTHAALEALDDDINTPLALVAIEKAFDAVESASLDSIQHSAIKSTIDWIDAVLGLELAKQTPDISDEQKKTIIERNTARNNKDWAKSDELRDKLAENGIVINDTSTGSRWYKESV